MKEHAIVIVMANAGYAGASIYATDILISQEVFYGQKFGYVSCLIVLLFSGFILLVVPRGG